jgi:indole-3-acetate monooxygenase
MASGHDATKLLESAKAFRPRILAERDRIESDRRLPDDLARELASAGFFRIFLPSAYGGLDLSPLEAIDIYEELARADASVAWCIWNGNVHWTTARLHQDVAELIFDDPDMILANSTRPSGRATIVEGGYRVSGRWSLVSGCQLSAWFILLCVLYEDGQARATPAGTPEYRFMLCPASDCHIIDTWTVSGLRGTGSHDVVVKDCFIPARYASYSTDPIILTAPRYQIPSHSRVAPGLGAIALGIARSAIEALIQIATEKRHERSGQALGEDRGAQTRLAQAQALVRSARLFLADATRLLWDDVLAGREATVQRRAEVRLASWHAVTSAAEAVDLVYLTGGATSLYATSPIERAFRDVHAVTQHIGVHPRNLEAVGRVLFGLEPDTPTLLL